MRSELEKLEVIGITEQIVNKIFKHEKEYKSTRELNKNNAGRPKNR